MNFAKVWQYLVSGLEFTELQEYMRKYCYSWKCFSSAAFKLSKGLSGSKWQTCKKPFWSLPIEIFGWAFKSWALEPVYLFPPVLSLVLYWSRSTCRGTSRVVHHCCQVQITSPANVNLICCSCWQLWHTGFGITFICSGAKIAVPP